MASAPTAPAVGAAATPPGEWRPPGRSRTASVVTLEGFLAAVARIPGSCVEYADGSVKVSFSDRRDRKVQEPRQKPASGPPAAAQPHKSRAMLRREQRQRQAQRQQQQQQPPETPMEQPVEQATEQQHDEQLAGVEPAAADEAAVDAWLDEVAMGAEPQREQNAAARASGFAAAAAASLRAALDDVAIANVASDRRAAATDGGKRQAAVRMQ